MNRRHRWTNLAPALTREGLRVAATDTAELPVNDFGEPELMIYDYIDAWGGEWGVSAADVMVALDQLGSVPALAVRLNSPGGDYFEGVAIYNALVRHPANVTIYVDALAASAASVIAMAGNKVVMGQGSQIMIHEARSGLFGATAAEFRAQATMLDQTNDDIAGFYAARTGGDVAAWREAVAVETWYTAAQALDAGLADEVATPPARGGLANPAAAALIPVPADALEPVVEPIPLAPDPGVLGASAAEDLLTAGMAAFEAAILPEPPAATPDASPARSVFELPTNTPDLAELIRSAVRK